ncbi:MAG: ATP-binding protein [Pseudomonadota bacterium]
MAAPIDMAPQADADAPVTTPATPVERPPSAREETRADGDLRSLVSTIRGTADRVRLQDFLWMGSISVGIALVLLLRGVINWQYFLSIEGAYLAALVLWYRLSSGRIWARSTQELIEARIGSQENELSALRLARKVAQILPEPLFILHKDGIVDTTNPAADDFIHRHDAEGRHLASVLRAAAVFEAVETVAQDNKPRTVDFATAGSVKRFCRAYVAPLDRESEATDRILLFVRDMTGERRVEQMRVDFIASASHELRTPLASLIGFIETLRGPAKNDPVAQKKFLKIMQKQAERMQRLVADLMSLSRIELNEHITPEGIVDLNEVGDEVVEGLRPLIEKSEAMVAFSQTQDAPCLAIAERDEIVQAAQNLVQNAIKYGGDPAQIQLQVGHGEAPMIAEDAAAFQRAGDSAAQVAARLGVEISDLIYLQVRDYGPGIERADLPRLTERFYRVNVERSRNTGGTGLGLAIVKHIMTRHKGGLQIETRIAMGTAFTCYFLAARPDQAALYRAD